MLKKEVQSKGIMNPDEECCGACCHFEHEDIDGWGICPYIDAPIGFSMHCSDLCTTEKFVSHEAKRHHLAMLRKCQRCLGENVGTKQDLDVKEIGEAIEFVVDYVKIH